MKHKFKNHKLEGRPIGTQKPKHPKHPFLKLEGRLSRETIHTV